MSAPPSSTDLLSWAEAAMTDTSEMPTGVWQRAAAILARQALEHALDELCRRRVPGLEGSRPALQVLCLRDDLGDPELAARASHVWWSLTNACHHHPYELSPTAAELRGWLATVAEVIAASA